MSGDEEDVCAERGCRRATMPGRREIPYFLHNYLCQRIERVKSYAASPVLPSAFFPSAPDASLPDLQLGGGRRAPRAEDRLGRASPALDHAFLSQDGVGIVENGLFEQCDTCRELVRPG